MGALYGGTCSVALQYQVLMPTEFCCQNAYGTTLEATLLAPPSKTTPHLLDHHSWFRSGGALWLAALHSILKNKSYPSSTFLLIRSLQIFMKRIPHSTSANQAKRLLLPGPSSQASVSETLTPFSSVNVSTLECGTRLSFFASVSCRTVYS